MCAPLLLPHQWLCSRTVHFAIQMHSIRYSLSTFRSFLLSLPLFLSIYLSVCLSVCLCLAPRLLPFRMTVYLFHFLRCSRILCDRSFDLFHFICVYTHNTHAIFLPVAVFFSFAVRQLAQQRWRKQESTPTT